MRTCLSTADRGRSRSRRISDRSAAPPECVPGEFPYTPRQRSLPRGSEGSSADRAGLGPSAPELDLVDEQVAPGAGGPIDELEGGRASAVRSDIPGAAREDLG